MSKEKKPLTAEQALLRMADLCARSEQCPYDIAKKMRAKALSEADIHKVIDELRRRRFIDERRFAASFARDKVRFAGWGRLKIRTALAARRIPQDAVAAAMESIEPADYRDALIRAARAKASALNLKNYDDRARLCRHLLSRGFEPALVTRLMDKIGGL